MNISIWDLDWFYKKTTLPNVDCMRLSSYYKQKGYSVSFIKDLTDLNIKYEKIYIKKDLDETPYPSINILNDNKTILLGKGFRYNQAKQLNAIITACRPDYLLYDIDERNSYANANFITFYAGKTLIKTRQDFHNTLKYTKRTIVTDTYLWKAPHDEILFCLEELKNEKNVAFLNPISIKTILSNENIKEKFLKINFSIGTIFKWKNDYSNNVKDINNIINFLLELKQNTKSNIGFIPIKSFDETDNVEENFDIIFLNCMLIIDLFKKNNLKCRVIVPKELNNTKKHFFNLLEDWTTNYFELSFIEYILHNLCYKSGILWYNILNNPIKWRNKNIDFLLYLLTSQKWEDYRYLLYRKNKDEDLNYKLINFNKIKEQINLLFKGNDNE